MTLAMAQFLYSYCPILKMLKCGMEIFFKEINKGQLNFELSVHDNNVIDNPLAIDASVQPPFHVYITARDESARKIWKTPLMVEGKIKDYTSIDDAIQDARNKID
jgi:hypothetical protein